jgi:hypothetical protein
MTLDEKFWLVPLEELSFAPLEYPWDSRGALERVRKEVGYKGLASYSLVMDPEKDAETPDAYPALVVDIIDGLPLIVPGALESVKESVSNLAEDEQEFVLNRLDELSIRLDSTNQQSEERKEESQMNDNDEHDEGQGNVEDQKNDLVCNEERTNEGRTLIDRFLREGKLLKAWDSEALLQFISGLSKERMLTTDGYENISQYDFFLKLLDSIPSFVSLDELAAPSSRRDNPFENLGRKIANALKDTKK